MATVVSIIKDPAGFWSDVVNPDYREFLERIDDLRRAFHCAISLFHLADWIYVANRPAIDASFTFTDKNGSGQRVYDEKTFANALADICREFELVRGIANSAKHLSLRSAGRDPSSPTHAANTRSQSPGWGEGGYGSGPYGGTPRVMLEGPGGDDLEFSELAQAVHNMWLSLSATHGWGLS